MKVTGSAFLVLLLGMLILGMLSVTAGRSFLGPRAPGAGAGPGSTPGPADNPLGYSLETVCRTNRLAIQQALQMYNLSHAPMKTLDMAKLRSVLNLPPMPGGMTCSYRLDERGDVVCDRHR